MKTIGAAKVMTRTGPVWCHFSQQDNVTKLRRYSEGAIYEVENESDEIEAFVPLKVCKTLVSAKSYSVHEFKVWTEIFHKLEMTVETPVKDTKESKKRPQITVPITVLRQFYETMKLLETATWVNLAEFYANNPKSLERLWNKSRTTFEGYRNDDNWGRGKTEEPPSSPESVGAIKSTDDFTAFIRANENWLGDNIIGYEFVERELNPRRTSSGVFSNKLPATKSGAGGIDVLLKSKVTGFPTVGEVKVKTDKNALFALIQAMTYAVELSTPNQISRLKKYNKSDFGKLTADVAKVEIALLMVNHNKDKSRDPVLKLIKKINRRKKCEGLGKVVLIENQGEKWTCLP